MLSGQIDPGGQITSYQADYDLQGSDWCMSGGTSGSPADTTSGGTVSGTGAHNVSVALTGKTTHVHYCAELVATNGDGEDNGAQVTWLQDKREADTFDASPTSLTSATVEGDVNPEGQFSTTYQVQYGPTSSDGCTSSGVSGAPANTTNPADLGFSDDTFHDVSVNLIGLTTGGEYCAQLITGAGTTEGDGGQVTWTESLPDAVTFDAYSTGASTVTVEGVVNPAGETTGYALEYDLASSDWCTSGGTSGSPATTTDFTDLGSSDPTYQFVSPALAGLTAGAGYCAQLIASNASGDADGGQITWTQGSPTADTFDAFSTGLSTATVGGDVNPAGEGTSYVVKYDLDSSEWCTSGGSSGTPGSATAPQILPFSDGTFHDVSLNLTGLASNTGYCAEIVASNGTGGTPTDDGDQVFWTQPAPPPQFILTVSVSGGGSGKITSSPTGIDCGAGGSACSKAFPPGTVVTLTATPAAGSVLTWAGPGCLQSHFGSTCTVTMHSDENAIVFFERPPAGEVIIQLAGSGSGTVTSSPAGIDCGSVCSQPFSTASPVTLTATPSSGSTFAGWSGGGCSGTGTCTNVPPMNSSMTVTATFTENSPPPHPSCRVPKVKGKKLTAAKAAIRNAHCSAGKITKAFSAKTKKGRIISQKPAPGTRHPAGTKIKLTVSKGPKPRT
jgi:hypothetical protein